VFFPQSLADTGVLPLTSASFLTFSVGKLLANSRLSTTLAFHAIAWGWAALLLGWDSSERWFLEFKNQTRSSGSIRWQVHNLVLVVKWPKNQATGISSITGDPSNKSVKASNEKEVSSEFAGIVINHCHVCFLYSLTHQWPLNQLIHLKHSLVWCWLRRFPITLHCMTLALPE